jgi:hypothetical protein
MIAMHRALAVFLLPLVAMILQCLAAVADESPPRYRGRAMSDAFAVVGNQAIAPRQGRTGSGVQTSASATASGTSTGSTGPWVKPFLCERASALAVCGGTSRLCTMGLTVENGDLVGGGRAPDPCPTAQTAAVAAAGPAPLPQVTPGVVLTALREIGLPALQARTQPEDKTLVNFATIFYTDPQPFSRTVTLLGRQVRIDASPSSYTWHYGDGSTRTTTSPGAPYPAKDVTHEYRDAHVTVLTSVDVTYTATFRVGGGAQQAIPGSVTIPGPGAPLRISEATAVLSGNHQ